MRVLFTSAPEPGSAVEAGDAWLPLALVHLAGAVRAAGHECEIVDALTLGLSAADVEGIVRQTGPDVVCVSAATPGFPAAMDLCQPGPGARAGSPSSGGVHASFMYPEFLPSGAVDFAVVGEGEETLPELLRCLAAGDDPARVAGIAFGLGGRVIRTAPRPRLAALDPLPKAWDLIPVSRYRWAGRPGARTGAISTSRGCPRRCASCCHATQYEGTWRTRSVDSVAYELVQLRREHDVELVAFYDPAPAADARRFAELTERLVELDLGLEIVIWSQRRRHPPRRGGAPSLALGRGGPRRDLSGTLGGPAGRSSDGARTLGGAAGRPGAAPRRHHLRDLLLARLSRRDAGHGRRRARPGPRLGSRRGPLPAPHAPARTRRRGEPTAPTSSPATTVATTSGTRW